jgi:hypothetical protein
MVRGILKEVGRLLNWDPSTWGYDGRKNLYFAPGRGPDGELNVPVGQRTAPPRHYGWFDFLFLSLRCLWVLQCLPSKTACLADSDLAERAVALLQGFVDNIFSVGSRSVSCSS